HKILDCYCALHYNPSELEGRGFSRLRVSLGKGNPSMFKVEDMQSYGKEQLERAVAHATSLQSGFSAIVNAYGDYTKKSYEDTKSFVEKLSGVKSIDKALEAQT